MGGRIWPPGFGGRAGCLPGSEAGHGVDLVPGEHRRQLGQVVWVLLGDRVERLDVRPGRGLVARLVNLLPDGSGDADVLVDHDWRQMAPALLADLVLHLGHAAGNCAICPALVAGQQLVLLEHVLARVELPTHFVGNDWELAAAIYSLLEGPGHHPEAFGAGAPQVPAGLLAHMSHGVSLTGPCSALAQLDVGHLLVHPVLVVTGVIVPGVDLGQGLGLLALHDDDLGAHLFVALVQLDQLVPDPREQGQELLEPWEARHLGGTGAGSWKPPRGLT